MYTVNRATHGGALGHRIKWKVQSTFCKHRAFCTTATFGDQIISAVWGGGLNARLRTVRRRSCTARTLRCSFTPRKFEKKIKLWEFRHKE